MKNVIKRHSYLQQACILLATAFLMVSCGKDDKTDTPSERTDTVWVQQPYDTTAASEGRVWRSEDHWIVENNSQPQLCGYSVTLTRLEDSCFRSDVYVKGDNFYVRFFEDGVTYRYRILPNAGGDTLLLALPIGSAEDFDPTSGDAFIFKRLSDSQVKLRLVLSLEDEGIEQFDFRRIQP